MEEVAIKEVSEEQELTLENFEFFKDCHKLYLRKFGLLDWKVYYDFCELERSFAVTNFQADSRIALTILGKIWPKYREINEETLELCAKHEAIHYLTQELWDLSRKRFVTLTEIDKIEEALVVKLEKLIP
jgi:hypothetical protein